MDRVWNGSGPIVLGLADENGKPVKTFTLNPGDEIPQWFLDEAEKTGQIDMIGQDNPFDMSGVEKHYKNKWRNQQ